MRRICLSRMVGGAVAILMLTIAGSPAVANLKERIDYWRSNYVELTGADDPRAERAHEIFQRIVDTAGKQPGVVPRLFITKRDPLNVSLPIAIPDGWVILSKGTLDTCYREPHLGEDRLAFVLAHEIAHQLKGDFWHMHFFQALEASKMKNAEQRQSLQEIRRIIMATDEIWAKELQADERGIIYAAMAGFNTSAIVTEDDRVNFFREWVETLDPQRISKAYQSPSHPEPQHRAAAIKARLRQVLDKAEIFDLGLRYYQVGDYSKAVRAFEHFLEFFHSREVYHNLAASHHQLALRYYRQAQPDALPFKLTVGVDPTTRARGITLRGFPAERRGPMALFHEHIDKAIEFYKAAISLDSEYALSFNNLGCALIVKGPEGAFEAIATLQKAHKMQPDAADILNNLGVAFYLAKLPQQAHIHLQQARERDRRYNAPLFNLGKIAHGAQRHAAARRYWRDYLRLDAVSSWAELLRRQDERLPAPTGRAKTAVRQAEHVMGVTVAAFEDEIPQRWGQPGGRHRILLEAEPLTVTHYPQGITTFSQEEEIVMILALEEYRGKSAMGIAIGSSEKAVLDQYRIPSRTLDMTQGESWVYDEHGISFQIRNGRVVSWLLF